MKNLLLILALFVSVAASSQVEVFSPGLHTTLSKPAGVSISGGGPLDAVSQFYKASQFKYRDYRDTAEIKRYLNLPKWRQGKHTLFVHVGGTLINDTAYTGGTTEEWWFKDGVADNNLVKKLNGLDSAAVLGLIPELHLDSTQFESYGGGYGVKIKDTLLGGGSTDTTFLSNRIITETARATVAEALKRNINDTSAIDPKATLTVGQGQRKIDSLANDYLKPLGVLYNKNSWANLADFTQVGTPTVSIVSNKINISGGSGTFTNRLDLSAYGATYLEHYKYVLKVRVNTIAPTNYGIGVGVYSTNTYLNSSICANGSFTASGSPTVLYYNYPGGSFSNFLSSTTFASFSAGDYAIITLQKDFSTYKVTVRNATTNSAPVEETYTNISAGENTGNFSIYNIGGSYTIDSISITTSEITRASALFIGDSKTYGTNATSKDLRFTGRLANIYNSIVNVGAGGDRTADILARLNQIISLKPKQVYLGIGSNDLRSGVSNATFQSNYTAISNTLIAAGIDVYYLLPFYETAQDLSGQRTWILSNFPSAKIIDTWTPMLISGSLDADNVHLTNVGHARVSDAITQANTIKEAKPELPFQSLNPLIVTSNSNEESATVGFNNNIGPVGSVSGYNSNYSFNTSQRNNLAVGAVNSLMLYSNGGISSGGTGSVRIFTGGAANERVRVFSNGNTAVGGVFTDSLSANLILKAGTTTLAPLVMPSGVLTSSAINGTIENDGNNFYYTANGVRYALQRVTNPPATSTSTGVIGTVAFDSGFVYYCYATNTWVRAALSTW